MNMRRGIGSAHWILGLAFSGFLTTTAWPQAANTPAPPPAQDQAQTKSDATPKPADSHVFVLGDSPDAKSAPEPPTPLTNVALSKEKISKENKLELIRGLNAEIAYAKKPLPRLEKGLVLPANGRLEPGDGMLNQLALQYGLAAKKGERVQITDMLFKDNAILFELNGGAKTKHKWYEHVSVGVGGAEAAPLAKPDDPRAKGLALTLTFPKYVPQISVAEVRELLSPILDFSVKSPTQAYADTLPPKIKAAVLDHSALVGMNREMVLAALGRPDKKFRDEENNTSYEDWMYGQPPATVRFMRFEGERLVRIKELPLGAEAIVRDQPEVDGTELAALATQKAEHAEKVKEAKVEASRPKPTLQRPGDQPPVVDTTANSTSAPQPLPRDTSAPSSDPNSRGTDADASGYPQQQQQRRPPGQVPGMPTPPTIPGGPGGDGSGGPR